MSLDSLRHCQDLLLEHTLVCYWLLSFVLRALPPSSSLIRSLLPTPRHPLSYAPLTPSHSLPPVLPPPIFPILFTSQEEYLTQLRDIFMSVPKAAHKGGFRPLTTDRGSATGVSGGTSATDVTSSATGVADAAGGSVCGVSSVADTGGTRVAGPSRASGVAGVAGVAAVAWPARTPTGCLFLVVWGVS